MSHTRVLEEILLLREYGCTDITIGEGAPFHKELNLSTLNGYQSMGLTRLAEKSERLLKKKLKNEISQSRFG